VAYRLSDPDPRRVAETKLREVAERALEARAAELAATEEAAAKRARSLEDREARAALRRYHESFHWLGWFAFRFTTVALLVGFVALIGFAIAAGESAWGAYEAVLLTVLVVPLTLRTAGAFVLPRAAAREQAFIAALPFAVEGHEALLSRKEPEGLRVARCTFDGPAPDVGLVQGLVADARIEATVVAENEVIAIKFEREASLSGYEAHRRFRLVAPVLTRLGEAFPLRGVALG
jgi:hypothetical protein